MALKINQARLQEIRADLQKTIRAARAKVYDVDAALGELKGELVALKDKGFDSKEISDLLQKGGLSVSAKKVKSFLTETDNQDSNSLKRGKNDKSAAAPEDERRAVESHKGDKR